MRPLTALRWTGSSWFLPALFAVSCLVGASDTIVTGYATADIASSSYALYIAGPVTAGYVAARFGTFPRFARPLRSRRSGLRVTFATWWPMLAGAPLVVCAAVLTTARSLPTDRWALSLLLIDFLTVMACAMLGLGFAWALPVVVAVPAVTVLWFLWLAYGPSTSDVLLHNLGPTFAACCDTDARPATVAIEASLTVVGVTCLGVAVLLVPRRWASRSRLALAPIVLLLFPLGLGAGALLAQSSPAGLTLAALQPRTTPLQCQRLERVSVCLWPESRGRAHDLAAIASTTNPDLERWRLPPIDAITQSNRDSRAVSVQTGDQLTRDDLRYSLAAGYVDRQAGCVGGAGSERDERVALVSLAAGLTHGDLVARFGSRIAGVAQERWERAASSPTRIRAWFVAGLSTVRCGPP